MLGITQNGMDSGQLLEPHGGRNITSHKQAKIQLNAIKLSQAPRSRLVKQCQILTHKRGAGH